MSKSIAMAEPERLFNQGEALNLVRVAQDLMAQFVHEDGLTG
jgi:hypothetical protein